MEHHRIITNELKWHNESGTFTVQLINGSISSLAFCEIGTGTDDCKGKCLTSTDYKFLKQVQTALAELFDFMEAESKKMGHTFANDYEKETISA